MARAYLEEIRNVQPHGPYYLGGESFGGLVAYEIACRIVASGERVALVFLGDIWTTNIPEFRRWRYSLSRLSYLFTLSWVDWSELFARKVLRKEKADAYIKRYTFHDDLHRKNSLAHRQASGSYFPGRYSGKVVLFRALDSTHETRRLQHYFGTPRMSWATLALGGVDVHQMPGAHREMMHGVHASRFARVLQACIDQAREQASDGI
jgi:thioesterase domain-containing protein